MEAGDFTPLHPMSVQDTIWVMVAQREKQNQKIEFLKQKREIETEDLKVLCLIMSDIRHLLLDSDWYTRITACKDSKKMLDKLKPLPVDELPSMREAKEREKQEASEAMAKMTREERVAFKIKLLREGKEVE